MSKQLSLCSCIVFAGLMCLLAITITKYQLVDAQRDGSNSISNNKTSTNQLKQLHSSSKCPKSRDDEMDKCASSLGFFGDRSFQLPRTINDMTNFCEFISKSLKCIQTYARDCLTSFPRQVLSTVARNGRKLYNQLCSSDSAKSVLPNKLSCLSGKNLEPLHQCVDGSIGRFEHVVNKVAPDMRIPAICCSYQIFNRDLTQTIHKSCSVRPAETAEYLHEIVGITTGELVDLVCGSYKSIEQCRATTEMSNLVDTFTNITTKVKNREIKTNAKSLISLFIIILNSL